MAIFDKLFGKKDKATAKKDPHAGHSHKGHDHSHDDHGKDHGHDHSH